MHRYYPFAGLLLTLYSMFITAHADEHRHRQHTAHEHGAGTLNIAIEGNTLMIELASPAMNIVGFEHAPHDAEQRLAVTQAAARLRRGEELFLTPKAAACSLKEATVGGGLLEEGGHNGPGDAHADFDVTYHFECDTPAKLGHLTTQLFMAFPTTKELEVQLLSEQGQRAAKLTAANPQLNF